MKSFAFLAATMIAVWTFSVQGAHSAESKGIPEEVSKELKEKIKTDFGKVKYKIESIKPGDSAEGIIYWEKDKVLCLCKDRCAKNLEFFVFSKPYKKTDLMKQAECKKHSDELFEGLQQ